MRVIIAKKRSHLSVLSVNKAYNIDILYGMMEGQRYPEESKPYVFGPHWKKLNFTGTQLV